MPVTRQAVGQRNRQYWKQQKNERKIPQMKEKKRNYSRTTGTKKPDWLSGFFAFSSLELVALTGEGYSTPNVYILFTMVL